MPLPTACKFILRFVSEKKRFIEVVDELAPTTLTPPCPLSMASCETVTIQLYGMVARLKEYAPSVASDAVILML